MFHRKNSITGPARESDPVRPRSGNGLIRAETGLRAAPWLLAALAALATAILLTLATSGTAQAATSFNMTLAGWNETLLMDWNSRNGEMYRYKIRVAGEATVEQQGEWSEWRNLQRIPAERHRHTITGLEAGNKYMVKLEFKPDGNVEGYVWAPVGTRVARVKPAAPENLSYTLNDDNSVTLTWDDPQDPSLTVYLYRITVRGEEGDCKQAIDFTADEPPENTTSYTIEADELTEAADNVIKLIVQNHAGGNSSSVTVSVPDSDNPPIEPEVPVKPTPSE